MSDQLQRLLTALGRRDNERVAICYMRPGGRFTAELTTVGMAQAVASKHADEDCWFSVQPLSQSVTAGRGKNEDIVGLRDLYADLDVKPGGMADFSSAREVIDDLSRILERKPVAIVSSGHGLQPHWAIDFSDPFGEATWKDVDSPGWLNATALLRRWGRLVAGVVESRGGRADSLYDLTRVLRVPGTVNLKDPHHPVPTTVEFFESRPIDLDDLDDVLNCHGVPETDDDRLVGGSVISNHGDWTFAAETCSYVTAMVAGWDEDTPGARHPWLISQATRLAAAHRNGCVSEDDYIEARARLEARFKVLLRTGRPSREPQYGEVYNGFRRGVENVEGKTDDDVVDELGGHEHLDLPSDEDLYFGQAADFPDSRVSEEESTADGLLHYDVNDLDAIPLPTPLIAGVLDVDTVAILSGKFGTYKSFMALAWGACLATGRAWCGHDVPEAVPVIYVAAEGAAGIRRRMAAWSTSHGRIDRGMFIVVPMRVSLSKPDSVRKLDALIKKYGAKMVVLDTLHKMAPGMEETSKDAGEALAIIDQLRQRNAATFLLVHHTGHAGRRARGSSSIEDDVDTSWVIELGGDGEDRSAANPRTLIHRKSKEEELSAPLNLRIVPVEGTDSVYVDASGDPFDAPGGSPPKASPGRPRTKTDDMLHLVDLLTESGGGCDRDAMWKKGQDLDAISGVTKKQYAKTTMIERWNDAVADGTLIPFIDSHGNTGKYRRA